MEPRPGVCTKWARMAMVMAENRTRESPGYLLGFKPALPHKGICERGFCSALGRQRVDAKKRGRVTGVEGEN